MLTWTDTTLTPDVTRVRKPHIDEIRTYLNNHIGVHTFGGAPVHPLATETNPGFMSAAQVQALVTATTVTNGTISDVTIDPSTGLSRALAGSVVQLSISASSAIKNGYMSSANWSKLNTYPNDYSEVDDRLEALESTKGSGTVTTVNASAPLHVVNPTTTPTITIDLATTTTPGAMSAADKVKLDATDNDDIGTVKMWYARDETEYLSKFTNAGVGKIGTKWEKWAICNGVVVQTGDDTEYQTPDMRNRFALGATSAKVTQLGNRCGVPGGEEVTKLKPEHLPKHRHATGQFTGTTNNDLQIETTTNTVEELKAYKFQAAMLYGDSDFDHGYTADVGSESASRYRTWTSQNVFDTADAATAHNTMPPFITLFYVIKVKE